MEELIKQLSSLAESGGKTRITELQVAGVLDEHSSFMGQHWDQEKQQLQPGTRRMSISEAQALVRSLAPLLLEPLIVHRFHSARPLAEEYKGAHLALFLEIGLRHQAADQVFQDLSSMCNMSVMTLINCRLRKQGQRRSPLAQEIQSQLNEPGRQQDAAELLQHIGMKIPAVRGLSSEMRILIDGVAVSEDRSLEASIGCMSIPASHVPSLTEIVQHWHSSDYGVRALISSPPLAYLQLNRFHHEADGSGSGKRATPIVLEDEFALPVFNTSGISVEWVLFKIGALVLHYGASSTSGHYVTAVPCDGGYVLADDDKPTEYLATLSAYQISNIYLIFLIKK